MQRDQPAALVLVVDDDPDLRTVTALQLGAEGFEVIEAADGEQCLALALNQRPDVILLDVLMPVMDGRKVLDELRAQPETRTIPVIFFSALGSIDDRIEGLERGAIDYIVKPAEQRELIARVRAAARRGAEQRAAHAHETLDQLTGMPGMSAFRARLEQEVARCRRSGAQLSLVLFELDRQEHRQDIVARAAGVLANALRGSDLVFRTGPASFACILPDAALTTALQAAERCRALVAAEIPGTTLSAGAAEAGPGRGWAELYDRARSALGRARASGGDRTWQADDPRKSALNPAALAAGLTEREWMVLAHLANNRTEREIARRLGIRPGTVRSHKARIRRKLGLPHDTRLSDFARRNYAALAAQDERALIPT